MRAFLSCMAALLFVAVFTVFAHTAQEAKPAPPSTTGPVVSMENKAKLRDLQTSILMAQSQIQDAQRQAQALSAQYTALIEQVYKDSKVDKEKFQLEISPGSLDAIKFSPRPSAEKGSK